MRLLVIRQEKMIKGLIGPSYDDISQPLLPSASQEGGGASVSPSVTDLTQQDWNEPYEEETTPGPSQSQSLPPNNTDTNAEFLSSLQATTEFLSDLRISPPDAFSQSSNNMDVSPSSGRQSWRLYDSNDIADSQQDGNIQGATSMIAALAARSSQLLRGRGRARGRGRGRLLSTIATDEEITMFTGSTNPSRFSHPPLIDLTMDLEQENFSADPNSDGYFLMREPSSPDNLTSGGFHNSEYFPVTNQHQRPTEHESTVIVPPEKPEEVAVDTVVQLSYEQICEKIVRNSLFLLLGVKSAVNFNHSSEDKSGNFSAVIDDIASDVEEEGENLPSAKSSETFRSPESRHCNAAGLRPDLQRKGAVIVRRLGRNILRYASNEVILSKRDWFSDGLVSTEGWNSETECIIIALKQQEERLKLRIEAFNQILELISIAKHTREDDTDQPVVVEDGQDFLSSVHEFLLAGCHQLGLSTPLHNPTLAGEGLVCLQLAHYLDNVQAAPIELQNQLITVVHEIMLWLISSIRSFLPDETLHSKTKRNVKFQSDESKLLNVFSISYRFKSKDIELIVNSGLITVLEKFVAISMQQYPSTGLTKGDHDLWPGLPASHYVTLASVRLLHMLAVSTA